MFADSSGDNVVGRAIGFTSLPVMTGGSGPTVTGGGGCGSSPLSIKCLFN